MRHPHRRGGSGIGHLIRRRELLLAGAGAALWPSLWAGPGRADEAAEPPEPPALPVPLLEQSGFVYISPLLADGRESRCHGEVWFGWLDGAVVINTAPSTWKSRALARGLRRARIWVGDHGRWKQLLGRNEAFRAAPAFEAEAESVAGDPQLLERLLALYDRKYPDEIGRWRDEMRTGYATGARLLLRYRPLRA